MTSGGIQRILLTAFRVIKVNKNSELPTRKAFYSHYEFLSENNNLLMKENSSYYGK